MEYRNVFIVFFNKLLAYYFQLDTNIAYLTYKTNGDRQLCNTQSKSLNMHTLTKN